MAHKTIILKAAGRALAITATNRLAIRPRGATVHGPEACGLDFALVTRKGCHLVSINRHAIWRSFIAAPRG
jgi:hypothetical protein